MRPSTLFQLAASVAAATASCAFAQQFQNQTASRFPAATNTDYTSQITFVDIEGDGDLDIVQANGQGYSSAGTALKPRIWVNNGLGVFTDETDTRAAGITGWFRGAEAGDIDGDGDMDLILAQDFNKKPILLINNGSGVFTNGSAQLPTINLSSSRANFGDVDNDGDLDIIICNSGTTSRFSTNGRPRLYLNDGLGNFTDAAANAVPTANIAEQMDIFFFDYDNDLDLDVYVGSRASNSQLWTNNGAGVFTKVVAGAAGMPVGGSSYSYDPGDIDGDGDLDLIGINSGAGSADLLLRNNFPAVAWTNISGQISPNPSIDDNDSRFFDFDNDGDLDLVIGSLGSTERIYANNGAGLFTQPAGIITAVADSSLDVKVADLDGDGKLDIVTAQGESGPFSDKIYENVTGPADTRAPKVKITEQVVPGASVGPFVVRAEVFDDYANDRGFEDDGVFLNYTINGGSRDGPITHVVEMHWDGYSLYRATLPAFSACDVIAYWVTATDRAGNSVVGPTKTFTIRGRCGVLGDLDGDGSVNATDLAILLGAWDSAGPGDLDGDGIVGASDLAILLGAWTG